MYGPVAGTPDIAENRLKWFKQGMEKIYNIKDMVSVAFPNKIGCCMA